MANGTEVAEPTTTEETIATNAEKGGTETTEQDVQQATGEVQEPAVEAPQPPAGGLQTVSGEPAPIPEVDVQLEDTTDVADSGATEQVAKAKSTQDLANTAAEIAKEKAKQAEEAGGTVEDLLEQQRKLDPITRGEAREEAEEKFRKG